MIHVHPFERYSPDAQRIEFCYFKRVVMNFIFIPGNGASVIGIAMDIEMVTADRFTMSQMEVVSGLVSLVRYPVPMMACRV